MLTHNEQQQYRSIDIDSSKDDLCGVGIRKTKIRLNHYRATDDHANLLRLLLEIEHSNQSAKQYYGRASLNYYHEKEKLLRSLVDICLQHRIKFGNATATKYKRIQNVFYVEIGDVQLSWFYKDEIWGIPRYDGVWDELEDSTLGKIEYLILKTFPFINEKKWQLTIPGVEVKADYTRKVVSIP